MRYSLFTSCFLLLFLMATGADAAGRSAAVEADSVEVNPAALRDSARVDSTLLVNLDPALAWQGWKDLSRAIALRPLDGPGDILEKAEIVQDRIDDLQEERRKIEGVSEEWEERRQGLELQLEMLDDLAELQRGGDLQLQQRMHGLREELGKASRRLRILEGSLGDLSKELDRLNGVVEQYEEKAEDLRRREEKER
jgi:hypothetical protein